MKQKKKKVEKIWKGAKETPETWLEGSRKRENEEAIFENIIPKNFPNCQSHQIPDPRSSIKTNNNKQKTQT